MNTVTQFSHHILAKPNSKMNMEQRGFYFIAGFGSIIAAMANPPESMLWMAVLNGIGIGLVILSILGKRLFSTRKESGFSMEPKQFTSIATGVIGIGLSVLAIAYPHTSLILLFYVHVLAISLVTHSLLDSSSLLKATSYKPIDTLPTDEPNTKEQDLPLSKAA